ncbi:uncharacterized protein LOC128723758 [Anopheles nili]|uniref:uncharacterized protein LOC128723758 n=1 Tax=Anopheles nili TaxID=185578 RepID=UPI00237AC762|nr:uncharacterized protein LOC128723758 [Anopheles nili]
MHPTVQSVLLIASLVCHSVRAAPNDGKYNPRKYSGSGKYVHKGDGDYVDDVRRYRYVHYDDGDRGRYFHVHIPYDGGYGNYEGGHEPYRFPPYDPAGEYAEIVNKYSSDPYRGNAYDISKPSIYLESGVPSVSESHTASSVVDVRQSLLPGPGTAYLPVRSPDELPDVRQSLLPGPGTAYLPVLTPQEEKQLASGFSNRQPGILPHPNSVDRPDHFTATTPKPTTTTSTTTQPPPVTTAANIPTLAGDQKVDHLQQPCLATSGPLRLTSSGAR